MPPAAVPFGRYRKPYYEWYVRPNTLAYYGAGRSVPEPKLSTLKAINIGFFGPIGKYDSDSIYGIPMLHGAQMAIDEANAHGGYHGKSFSLKVYDDTPIWGAAWEDVVKMYYEQHVWAMLGSIDGDNTHIELRAALKMQLPIIDTGTTDPTLTETRIQWLIHNFPDDRQQGYALADYIFNYLKLRQIGILRVNGNYGRRGYDEFFKDARRMGFQPMVVVKYAPGATSFTEQLHTLKRLDIDGLVIWGNAREAGLILKQMRAMGMQQPVFGSSRVAYPQVIKIAGAAANGLVAISAIDPASKNPRWLKFRHEYMARYHAEPGPYASYAYDGMTMLIASIQKAGLNRALIMDALRQYEMKSYQGVSGTAFFDYTLNNIAPTTFAKVVNGHFVYWPEHRTDWKEKPGGISAVSAVRPSLRKPSPSATPEP
ncbi:MAG TPA: ABC transporter substrate-binding protein [Acidobacteriaceae bacterium]|nr:ABC transporter substrate-binding protein [Acidobacteriaceae bacterium]